MIATRTELASHRINQGGPRGKAAFDFGRNFCGHLFRSMLARTGDWFGSWGFVVYRHGRRLKPTLQAEACATSSDSCLGRFRFGLIQLPGTVASHGAIYWQLAIFRSGAMFLKSAQAAARTAGRASSVYISRV